MGGTHERQAVACPSPPRGDDPAPCVACLGEAQQERNTQHHDAHVGGSVENLDDEGFRVENGRDSRTAYLWRNQAVPCPHAHDPVMGRH